ncbi:MAG: hypothetical protein Q4Q04_00780, partial [Methanocorpusculum sp.]|nr:hypothetical protein [Methanocorpusculum sp.]
IQILKPEVSLSTASSSIVKAYSLTPVGAATPYTANLFAAGNAQKEYGTDGTTYYTLPFVSGDTFLPYNSPPSQASEMTGNVTIVYKVNGVSQPQVEFSVRIPARVNLNLTSQAYAGAIMGYTENTAGAKDTLYVRLNDMSNQQSGGKLNHRISIYLNDGGVRTLLQSLPYPAYWDDYFTASGHALVEEYNLAAKSGDAVVEVYVTGSQSRDGKTFENTVWYIVGTKKVSELIS